jgi:DNA replication protein DnaC
MITNNNLLQRAKALKLYGLIAHWEEVEQSPWVESLIQWEEEERSQRSLERRLSGARLGRFKPMHEFDWQWPKKCDREAIEEWMRLTFIKQSTNLILCGPNGVGKSTIARNIAHQAILQGYTALFTTAGEMLNDLAAQDGDNALRRRIKRYVQPQLLIIDEVGYLSYSNRHADLLFEIVARRYEQKPTVVTTNKPFTEWADIFPNATCVVSLIDRLVHHSEIVGIEAESFRLKEAKEQRAKRKAARNNKAIKINTKNNEGEK